jgi:hypothetical protein
MMTEFKARPKKFDRRAARSIIGRFAFRHRDNRYILRKQYPVVSFAYRLDTQLPFPGF